VDGNLEFRHALLRDVDNVLDVMEKHHVIVVATEQQYSAVDLDKAVEKRFGAESIIPRLRKYEVGGAASPHDEPGDMIIHG
jgi:hypothetical protein